MRLFYVYKPKILLMCHLGNELHFNFFMFEVQYCHNSNSEKPLVGLMQENCAIKLIYCDHTFLTSGIAEICYTCNCSTYYTKIMWHILYFVTFSTFYISANTPVPLVTSSLTHILQLDPPHDRLNTEFFKEKPTMRKVGNS